MTFKCDDRMARLGTGLQDPTLVPQTKVGTRFLPILTLGPEQEVPAAGEANPATQSEVGGRSPTGSLDGRSQEPMESGGVPVLANGTPSKAGLD